MFQWTGIVWTDPFDIAHFVGENFSERVQFDAVTPTQQVQVYKWTGGPISSCNMRGQGGVAVPGWVGSPLQVTDLFSARLGPIRLW
jgi:hypothetical protein